MDKPAVVNASPLIFLSRGGHLKLLSLFSERILVPKAVAVEIRKRGPEDTTARSIETTSWLEVVPDPRIPDEIVEWGLGPGESSVLALAASDPGTEVIIDDLSARKCAAILGIPVRGTLGIVLAARNRGLIPSARAVMDELLESGLYLSRSIIDEALKRVGE